jgi:hypothetical protein
MRSALLILILSALVLGTLPAPVHMPGGWWAYPWYDGVYWQGIPQRGNPDLNGDGDVDATDLALLDACTTGPCVPVRSHLCGWADLNGDGSVDQRDFGIWQRGGR